MSEIRTLIDGKKISYSGLFRLDELYGIIRRFFKERGYWFIEKKNEEHALETGKLALLELEPAKRFNDYAKGKIRLSIEINNLKDKTVTVDSHKQKYQQADVNITFFVYLETDYRNQWEGTGFQFLLRTLTDKFIRRDASHEFADKTLKDANDIGDELKSYLNMSRFKISQEMHPHGELNKV